MSGFEVAGVVLGGFPLLLGAARPLSRYIQGTEKWWNFKNDITSLIATMEDESIAFSQNLELLLGPLNLDPDVQISLQQDPHSIFWRDQAIQSKIKQRLREQYFTWVWNQLQDMREALDTLHNMQPVKAGKVCFPSPGSVDYELLRFKQSFSLQKQPLLDRIVRINESLYKFLSKDAQINASVKSQELPSTKPSSGSMWLKPRTFIRLQSEAKKLLSVLQSRWHCRCHVQHQCGVGAGWTRPEEQDKPPKLKLLLDCGAESVAKIQTSLEVLTDEEQGHLSTEQDYGVPAKEPTSLEKLTGVYRELWTEKKANKLAKGKKKYDPGSTSSTTGSSTSAPVTSVTTSKKAVRFAHDSPTAVPASLPQSDVVDVCFFLRSTQPWDGRQYLRGYDHMIAFFFEPPVQYSPQSKVDHLKEFYKATPRLPDRLRVGIDVAIASLGFGTSPWLPKGWDRREIFMLSSPTAENARRIGPFFLHESFSLTLSEAPAAARSHAEATLFTVGVVLLELVFRETLEQQPCWAKFCDQDGRPNDWTLQCAAMDWQVARRGALRRRPVRADPTLSRKPFCG